MDTVTFPKFSILPKELRLYIWELSYYALPKHRIISLRDHLPSTQNINIPRPEFTPNDRHTLLQTCIESRSVALPILTSSFGLPTPGYHYISKNRQSSATYFLETQGFTFPDATGSSTLTERIPRTLEAMLVYYNAHPSEAAKHPKTLRLGAPFPPLEPPLWFDAQDDYLLLPLSRGELMTATLPSWTMCGTLLASKVQRIAIEISRRDWDWSAHEFHAVLPPIWSASLESGEVEFPLLDSVKEIALWTREGCELCHFKIAGPESRLKGGQWTFSLDSQSPSIFQERFGERWSNITWHVTFGRVFEQGKGGVEGRELNVCEMLRDWKPHSAKWWADKMEITKGVEERIGNAWKEMVQKWLDNRDLLQGLGGLYALNGFGFDRAGKLELFSEEDGVKNYLGPSFTVR